MSPAPAPKTLQWLFLARHSGDRLQEAKSYVPPCRSAK